MANEIDDFDFPNSLSMVMIGACEPDVDSQQAGDGVNFNDLIRVAALSAKKHCDFVRQVIKMASKWKKDGLITNK